MLFVIRILCDHGYQSKVFSSVLDMTIGLNGSEIDAVMTYRRILDL